VDWAAQCFVECLRVCRGLVAWVVEGQVRQYQWSATPALLMADLHRRGVVFRKPPIFHRVGVPGGGGNRMQHHDAGGSADWFRNDYEFILCATSSKSKLPWADTLALGKAPKFAPGGQFSNRLPRGDRVNHAQRERVYSPPAVANPGNIFKKIVGGGVLGSKLAHENEAPFPLTLAEDYVRAFCPPGGSVLDCFSGSGTTMHAAIKHGRHGIATDIRESQCELTRRRVIEAQEAAPC
jgi:hypothetical protein